MRALRSWLGLLGTVALASQPAPAGAQAVGSEFQINSYTTSSQVAPAVAADASGNFVVVWSSLGQDGSSDGIFGQRYDSLGVAVGDEFQVNTYTTGEQRFPAVGSDASGNFVVVWQSNAQDGDSWGVFGRRHDSTGVAQGSEFRINSFTTADQRLASVASDASGNFVVVWSSLGQDGSSDGVFGQRYDNEGGPLGSEFRVNSFTKKIQSFPSVASDASGNFVVVWESCCQDGNNLGIFGQRYDSAGVAQGAEFRVNSYTTDIQRLASVASDASGNFVVVWESFGQFASGIGIFGQRYDGAGVAQGAEFRVTQTGGVPSAAYDASGDFVVVWGSADGGGTGVFGQRYDSEGVRQGARFQINSFTTGNQRGASIATTGTGQWVVAWNSYGQDGSDYGAFGQRFDFAQSPGELLVNGGFEGGNCTPWLVSVMAQCVQGGPWPHAGTGYAQLGKNNTDGFIQQPVTIPPGAPANLTFWLNVDTQETTPNQPNDKLLVEVRDASNVLLATLATFSNLDGAPPGVYSQQAMSMAAFAGQTVWLTFHADSNTSLRTLFRVDDASLQ